MQSEEDREGHCGLRLEGQVRIHEQEAGQRDQHRQRLGGGRGGAAEITAPGLILPLQIQPPGRAGDLPVPQALIFGCPGLQGALGDRARDAGGRRKTRPGQRDGGAGVEPGQRLRPRNAAAHQRALREWGTQTGKKRG